jgi:hypothetical protein
LKNVITPETPAPGSTGVTIKVNNYPIIPLFINVRVTGRPVWNGWLENFTKTYGSLQLATVRIEEI